MNITTEFLTTIGELSNLILEMAKAEKALSLSLLEFERELSQTKTKRAEIESTMIDLIANHGNGLKEPKRIARGFKTATREPQIIAEEDLRGYLTKPEAAGALGVSIRHLEKLYRTEQIKVYRRRRGGRYPYLFLVRDVENMIDQKRSAQ